MVTANKPEVKDNKNKNKNKNNKTEVKENKNKNKNNKTEVKDNKNTNKNKSKSKPDIKHKNTDADKDKGPLDEKGNPFPIENPEGGDPICPGGYKIDYEFDPINDPINPPFRCIPTLKDPTDGLAGKALAMMNDPSSGIQDMAMGNLPGVGGRRRRSRTIRRKKRNGIFNTRRHRHRHRHTRHRRG
jgi:hypothetical protein